MDRLGLRVVVTGLKVGTQRLEVYHRMRAFADNPHQVIAAYAEETYAFGQGIIEARSLLPQVTLTRKAEWLALQLVRELDIASNRAEYVTLEAARAYAAADGRSKAGVADVRAVAPMALRHRRSEFMIRYFEQEREEEARIQDALQDNK
jgi:Mg-chelatase subunit ChlI